VGFDIPLSVTMFEFVRSLDWVDKKEKLFEPIIDDFFVCALLMWPHLSLGAAQPHADGGETHQLISSDLLERDPST
jgi:hypothetical protein